jgi:hypothetical protein
MLVCPWSFTVPSFVLTTAVQYLNSNIQPPSTFVFFFIKIVLLKVNYPLKICHHTQFHGSTLTGASFATTSEVRTVAILEWLKLRY